MIFLFFVSAIGIAIQEPVEVAPSALAKRADLAGRAVVVDGRVAYFQSHEGIFDELFLKKTPVPFRLPADLRARRNPDGVTARVQGVLKVEKGAVVVDVSTLKMLPSDPDRLKHGVGLLAAGDADGRFAWARWARFRSEQYDDPELLDRGRELDVEAIRIEAARPGAESAAGALRLARKAREIGVPEPEPSALAHRGFRARLAESRAAGEFEAIASEIESFFPLAREPLPGDASRAWDDAYRADPAAAYRIAPGAARASLDRGLWADAVAGSTLRQAADRPESLLAIADSARGRLPDRPRLSDQLERAAIDRALSEDRVSSLRRDEIDDLSRRLAARGEPDRVLELKRRWLEGERRKKLRPGDAEGRVLLAGQFEAILGDRASAVALLKEAWAIDPQSKETAEAFRRIGYRKVDDDWRPASTAPAASARPRSSAPSPASGPDEGPAGDPLRNLTRPEVRARLGEPARITRSLTLSGVTEQWVYPGTRRAQYVNFFYRPGMSQPLVQRSYSLPSP